MRPTPEARKSNPAFHENGCIAPCPATNQSVSPPMQARLARERGEGLTPLRYLDLASSIVLNRNLAGVVWNPRRRICAAGESAMRRSSNGRSRVGEFMVVVTVMCGGVVESMTCHQMPRNAALTLTILQSHFFQLMLPRSSYFQHINAARH